MKKENLISVFALLSVFYLGACSDSELLNDPSGKVDSPDIQSEIPDFSTSNLVNVSIDYALPGRKALLNFYLPSDIDSNNAVKKDAVPFFAIFSDDNGKFVGDVEMPKYLSNVYIACYNLGFPELISVDINNKIASYTRVKDTRAMTTDSPISIKERIDINDVPYILDDESKVYSIYSSFDKDNWQPACKANEKVYQYYTLDNAAGSSWNNFMSYINKPDGFPYSHPFLHDQLVNRDYVLQVPSGEVGHFDAVLLYSSQAKYCWDRCKKDAIGYYYYNIDKYNAATNKEEFIDALPKYIMTPLVNVIKPDVPLHIRLQYFGEDGKDKGIDQFPAGYAVGFMMVPDMVGVNSNNINALIAKKYKQNVIYSNQSANKNEYKASVLMVTDTKTKQKIIGFDTETNCRLNNYSDAVLYINSNINYDPCDNPIIPDCPDCKVECTNNSVLLFEDKWPKGDDYDMNDVMLQHSRTVTFDKDNVIVSIADIFTPKQDQQTILHSAFGFQILEAGSNPKNQIAYNVLPTKVLLTDEDTLTSISTTNPIQYEVDENGTPIQHQYIIFTDHKKSYGHKYTLTRYYNSKNFTYNSYKPLFNYFICPREVGDYVPKNKRVEVHMYGTGLTSLGDKKLALFDDDDEIYKFPLYGVDNIKGSLYPYALELNGIKDFEPVTPGKTIGTTGVNGHEASGEYPSFNQWADNEGLYYKAWYLYKDGNCNKNEVPEIK